MRPFPATRALRCRRVLFVAFRLACHSWNGLRQQVEPIDPLEAARSAAAVDAALEKYRAADALEMIDIAAYDADRQLIETEILALKAAAIPVPEPHPLFLQTLGGLVVAGLARRRRFRSTRG